MRGERRGTDSGHPRLRWMRGPGPSNRRPRSLGRATREKDQGARGTPRTKLEELWPTPVHRSARYDGEGETANGQEAWRARRSRGQKASASCCRTGGQPYPSLSREVRELWSRPQAGTDTGEPAAFAPSDLGTEGQA